MTKLLLLGIWHILKGKMRQKYAIFLADDMQYSEGKAEELLGRIQKRSGQPPTPEETAKTSTCQECVVRKE